MPAISELLILNLLNMKKEIHYNIRTVVAASKEEAIKKIQAGKFYERHSLCDKVFTKEQLLRKLSPHGKRKQSSQDSKQTSWDFVEKYYPNYHSADAIAYANDLQKIMDGEIEGDAKKLFEDKFGSSSAVAGYEYDAVHREIYERAIQNFLNPQENG